MHPDTVDLGCYDALVYCMHRDSLSIADLILVMYDEVDYYNMT